MGFFYLKQGENIIQSGETQITEFSVDFPSNYTDAPIEYTVEFIDDNNVSGTTTFTMPNCACEVSAVTEETTSSTTRATNIIISSITPSHASQVTLDYRGGDVPFYIGYDYVTSWQERSVSSDTCGNIAYGDWEDNSTTGHSAISSEFDCHKCFTIQDITDVTYATLENGNTYVVEGNGTQGNEYTLARINKDTSGDCANIPQYNALEVQDIGYGTDWITISTFNEASGSWILTSGIINANTTSAERTAILHYYTSGSTDSCPTDVYIRQSTAMTVYCNSCFDIQAFPISSEAATAFTKVAEITRKTDPSECSTVELPTSCTIASGTWINECSAKTTTNGVEIYAKYTENTTSTTRYGSIKLTDCNDLEINLVQNAAVISTNDYYLQVNAYLNGCDDRLNYNTIEVNVIRKSDSQRVYTYDEEDIDHTVSIDPPISANNTDSNRTYTITVDGTYYSADTYVGTVTQYTCARGDTLSLDITSAAESTGGQDAYQTTYFVRFNSVSLASGKQLTNPYIKINLREGLYDCSGNETNTSTSSHILELGESTPSKMSDYDGGRVCQHGGQFYDVHNWTGLFFSYETKPDGIQISAKDNLSAIQI